MTATRTRNDVCLLCKKNKATATNSHIYTKFITASMFGDKHNKQGGQINTANFNYGSNASDTPKENYLMCPNCENVRLGKLETYISTFFYNRYKDNRFTEKFPIDKRFDFITQDLDRMLLAGVHTGMFKLYIYSLVWRASISTLYSFKNFKLTPQLEEVLRNILDTFLQQDANDTISFYDSNRWRFFQFPFIIQTHLEQVSAGRNYVMEPMRLDENSLIIYLNEFIIIFHTKWTDFKMLQPYYNPGAFPINLVLLNEYQWRKLIRTMMRKTVNAWFSNHAERAKTEMPKSKK